MKKTVLALTLGASLIFTGTVAFAAPPVGGKGAAQNQATIPYYVDESKLPFGALEGYETDRYWGVHNGAGYRIEVPKNWNGKLVLYAHGYRGTGLELTVSNPKIRKSLLAEGYAWAASSYSTNGYDVAQGVKDTHALGSLFNGIVSKPSRTYITGHSMGGHITAVLAEQYSNSYDGALPMCGVTGDTELFDFFTDYNVVAQSLAGFEKAEQKTISDDEYTSKMLPIIMSKLGINEKLLSEEGQKLKTVTINLTGGERPLFDTAFTSWKNFLFGQLTTNNTYGVAAGNVVNTTDSIYQFDEDMTTLSAEERALNDSVVRVVSDPQTKQQGLTGVPKVNGTHKIPMVSIHTIGDLFVPFHMQQLHAERAEANGNEDILVTRVIRDVGHCGFNTAEESEAFADLAKWVEEGTKPEGDDILNPEVVSDEHFGTKFTRGYRDYDPEKKHTHE